jgi:acyl dehydratase
MALSYDRLMGMAPLKARQTFTRRDTMLYALGLGLGLRATETPADLQFVFEERLKALPTMAAVLGYPGFWMAEPQYGIDWKRILHAEQSLEMLGPLAVEGTVCSETTVETIYDKGVDKGALMYVRRRLFDEATAREIAVVRQGVFLRGNGGFGGNPSPTLKPRPAPERPPDIALQILTRPEQALIYRLSGDYNPLHASPEVAAQAGFEKPILHGLATYGIAGFAIVAELCARQPSRLRRFEARLSSPVYPGDTLRVEIWRDNHAEASIQVRALERDVVVLKNGRVEYGA